MHAGFKLLLAAALWHQDKLETNQRTHMTHRPVLLGLHNYRRADEVRQAGRLPLVARCLGCACWAARQELSMQHSSGFPEPREKQVITGRHLCATRPPREWLIRMGFLSMPEMISARSSAWDLMVPPSFCPAATSDCPWPLKLTAVTSYPAS